MVSLFCRHNRFTADCPICSKGTVLGADRSPGPRRSAASDGARTPAARGAGRRAAAIPSKRRPVAVVGPFEDADEERYELRLERVPGGLRLASFVAGQLLRRAPELPAAELATLLSRAGERGVFSADEAERFHAALTADPTGPTDGERHGASPGRSGDMREELRVERLDDDRLRIARWMFRPGTGWVLQEAPPMLPAARYAEAVENAARRGVLATGDR